MMGSNRYNERVVQVMSDKCAEARECRRILIKELNKVVDVLSDEKAKENLSYKEYEGKLKQKEILKNAINVAELQIDAWDKAREICLNIADEMDRN